MVMSMARANAVRVFVVAIVALLPMTGAAGAKRPRPRVLIRTIGSVERAVPRSFAGFSIEYTSAADYFGVPNKPNGSFIQLLRTLGAGGVGAPTIRMGGNSADSSWWNPDARARPFGVDNDLTPSWLSVLRPVAGQGGARFVLGANFAISDPPNAVAFLQAALAALLPGTIEALEIGNEADIYDRPATFQVGKITLTRPQRRPVGYNVPQYLAELDPYVAALNDARTPGWPAIAVGGFARYSWQVQAPGILDHVGGATRFFESHGYALNGCDRRGSPSVRRKRLLGPVGTVAVARAEQLVKAVGPRPVGVRVSEINSASCGGAQGVSDSFASALWGADVLFGMVEAGVVGVNFHSWSGAWYAPVSFGPVTSGSIVKIRPLLYGMLFFDRAVPNGARLLRVIQRRSDPVKVWATIDAESIVRVAVLNKDPRRATVVSLKVPHALRSGTVERLVAPTLASRTGVTFGGQSFGRGAFDGRLHGPIREIRVVSHKRVYRLSVPAGSAALLKMKTRVPVAATPK